MAMDLQRHLSALLESQTPLRTQYVVKIVGDHKLAGWYVGHNFHWVQSDETALHFDSMTAANGYAIMQRDLALEHFEVIPVASR